MAVGRADGVLYVKGAVEVVLPNCSTGVEGAAEANARMAGKGLRVLAVAAGMGYQESGLRLLGLVGLADPPRPEAIAAVQQARGAGIRTVMITGDHPATAHAIAQEMGLLEDGADPADHVHGRATAEDKLKIVASWKSKGHIVAMTGDGVNDAPALREAHIGIAMGRTGTEVTREAADMVLTDDNYASIVAAVREGRGIYENIRKTLVYLLAGNSGELALMLGAALVGLPPPLLPLQLLWINLVSDGLPALALSVDPAGPDALRRPPRRPNEPMLGRAQWRNILAVGLMEGSLVLAVFAWALTTRPEPAARDLCFTVLVFCELLRVFAARSATATFWELGVLSSPRLLAVVVLTILAQMAIHQVPAARALFHLGILPATDWLLCAGIGLVPVTVIETYKLLRR